MRIVQYLRKERISDPVIGTGLEKKKVKINMDN